MVARNPLTAAGQVYEFAPPEAVGCAPNGSGFMRYALSARIQVLGLACPAKAMQVKPWQTPPWRLSYSRLIDGCDRQHQIQRR
jgi:hypothetical protein